MNVPGAHAPRVGDRPWLDIDGDGVELSMFNGRPSAGLVSTDFGAVLFWQFFGHGTEFGLWLYLPLSDDEAEYIVERPDEPLLEGLHDVLDGRQGVLALSENGRVRVRGPYKVTGKPGSLVVQLLHAVDQGLDRARKTWPRSGRDVEFDADSDEAAELAGGLVRGALANC